jgi:hypothetical protein
MTKLFIAALCLCALGCSSSAGTGNSPELATLQKRIDQLETGIRGAEAIRSVKHLQYAYGHYAEFGLWNDLADLFADSGIGHYPSGDLGKEGIRRLFMQEVGKGKLGLSEGQFYPHIMLQPVVTLSPDGKRAKGRWRVLAMLGNFGGAALWAGGVYENEYVLEKGSWKISDLHYYSRFTGLYDQPGWKADKGEVPMHYTPAQTGTPVRDDLAWDVSADKSSDLPRLSQRLGNLIQRVQRLNDESEIENLQHIYGYYVDRKMWDDVADLFADDATLETGLQGVYVGRASIRRALNQFGPAGLREGEVNDHLQLQTIVHVEPDGRKAKARGVELAMTGINGRDGEWGEGIFENEFVKENAAWRIKALHYYPRMVADYDKGWAKDAKPIPGPTKEFPPDRPPTENYKIFPAYHLVPFHFVNPATGHAPQYPPGTEIFNKTKFPQSSAGILPSMRSSAELRKRISETERQLGIARAYDAAENLASAYGYYLDEFMWDETADLFTRDAERNLASIGADTGRENIRQSLKRRYPGKKSYEYLIVHQLLQPVIHVSENGQSAEMRVRLFQLAGPTGGAGSWISGIYETVTAIEDGIWKFKAMDLIYTWAADYKSGWAHLSSATKGIVATPFPKIEDLPFHYRNPVSGRKPPVFQVDH